MERIKYSLWQGTAHLSVIFSLMLLAFLITDRFNSAMAFVNHPLTKALVALLAAVALGCAVGHWILPLSVLDKAGRSAALPAALFALVGCTLVVADAVMPRWILFTYDSVKLVLLLTALSAAYCGVLAVLRIYRGLPQEEMP